MPNTKIKTGTRRTMTNTKKRKQKGGLLLPLPVRVLDSNRDYSRYGQIYCFGDIEGQFPFTRINKTKFTPLIDLHEYDASYARRESMFPKTSSTKTNFIHLDESNHIVIDTNSNPDHTQRDAFVFVGDLMDHGKYDIRWLHALVYNAHQDSLLCCIGNRDLNKIRRIDESFIIRENNTLIWDASTAKKTLTQFVTDIELSLTNYRFAYDYKTFTERFEYINKNDVDKKRIQPIFNKKYLDKDNNLEIRTRLLYAERLTAGISEFDAALPFPDYNYEELVELGLIERSDSHSINFKCLLIHITNMMMGVIWSEETVAMFPKGCHILNGLYIHYLNMAHIFSKMVTNNNSDIAIVCHGIVNKYISVPVGFTGSDNSVFDKFLSKNPAYAKTPAMEMKELFNIINDDKNQFISLFNTYWNDLIKDANTNYTYLSHNNYHSNPELYNAYHRFQDIFFVRTPFYKDYRIDTSNDLYDIKKSVAPVPGSVQKGGSYMMWKDLVAFEKEGLMTKSENYDFKYNIYGHSTHGLMPDILYVKDKKRYMIGLDISVVAPYSKPFNITTYNGMTNAYMSTGAFSYLVFKPTSVKIAGVVTKGNFETDPNVKFPIKYSKNINTFMPFKNLTFPESFISWKTLNPEHKLKQNPAKISPYEFLSKSPTKLRDPSHLADVSGLLSKAHKEIVKK